MKSKSLILLVVFIALLNLVGCNNYSEPMTGEVKLVVTKNFGDEIIYEGDIELNKKLSVMDILNDHLEIRTEYGGGFVNSINGMESAYTNAAEKEEMDWFYFANGIMTNVGATEYFPQNGDSIWWDYHPWGNIPFTPAVIGAFPQPFLNGYQGKNPGTLILVGESSSDLAKSVEEYLKIQGVENVEIRDYEESLVLDPSKITMVIGLWQEFSSSEFWQGIQVHRDKTGWFAQLEDDGFYSLDENADKKEFYQEDVGAVLATGMGMGDGTPLWLVTGLNHEGLENAIEVLISDDSPMDRTFNLLISKDEVISVPVLPGG